VDAPRNPSRYILVSGWGSARSIMPGGWPGDSLAYDARVHHHCVARSSRRGQPLRARLPHHGTRQMYSTWWEKGPPLVAAEPHPHRSFYPFSASPLLSPNQVCGLPFFNLAHDRQRPWCAESLRAVPFSSTMEEDHAPRRRRPCTPSCFSERYRHPAAVVEEHNHRVKQMPAAPMHPDSSPSCSLWLLRSPPHKKPGDGGGAGTRAASGAHRAPHPQLPPQVPHVAPLLHASIVDELTQE
jgi:hypothetical protein